MSGRSAPGLGLRQDYVRRAFAPALAAAGAMVTPTPQPGRLIDAYLEALDDGARDGPIAVGNLDRAVVAVAWALATCGTPSRCWSRSRHGRAIRQCAGRTRGPAHNRAVAHERPYRDNLRHAGIEPGWLADELTGRGPRNSRAFPKHSKKPQTTAHRAATN